MLFTKKHSIMRRKLFLPILFLVLIGTNSCAELQQVLDEYPISNTMDNATIASGLREALDKGIEKQVSKLTKKDGFNKNRSEERRVGKERKCKCMQYKNK